MEVFNDTGNYYSSSMEVELFSFFVNPSMMPNGSQLTCNFTTWLKLAGNANGRCTMVLETGTPGTEGADFTSVDWDNPIIEMPIYLTDANIPHSFGYELFKATTGATSAASTIYATTGATTSVPTNGSFIMRARLTHFDVENVTHPTGLFEISMNGATASIVKS
jgi:hypothetical protein